MAEFHFTGTQQLQPLSSVCCAALPFKVSRCCQMKKRNKPLTLRASPPYPTKPQCYGMNATTGYQTNNPPYPQGPSCIPHMPNLPYPNTSQLPCVSPQYGNCERVPAALSMASTIQNVAAPSPILPPHVNQQSFVSSHMVAQQHPLAPYKANQPLSSTFIVQSGSSVAVSNITSGYPASTQQPSKSLTKEIASAVMMKVIEHASKPKSKYKGNQLTFITGGGSTIIYK